VGPNGSRVLNTAGREVYTDNGRLFEEARNLLTAMGRSPSTTRLGTDGLPLGGRVGGMSGSLCPWQDLETWRSCPR